MKLEKANEIYGYSQREQTANRNANNYKSSSSASHANNIKFIRILEKEENQMD